MSIRIMTRVWEDSGQEGGSLLVLLAMADNADHNGICWPSTPHIARKARLSERQAQRVIDKLIREHELEIIKPAAGRGKRTVYRVTIKGDILSNSDIPKDDTDDKKRATSGTFSIIEKPSVEPSVSTRPQKIGYSIQTDPLGILLAAIYGRRPTTAWNAKEIKLFRAASKAGLVTKESVENYAWFFKRRRNATNSPPYPRRTLEVALNNWPGECDKSEDFCKRNPRPKARVSVRAIDTNAEPPKEETPEDKALAARFRSELEERGLRKKKRAA